MAPSPEGSPRKGKGVSNTGLGNTGSLLHFIFIILLLPMMPLSFSIGGELKIYSSEGVKTLKFPDPEPSAAAPERKGRETHQYDNYWRVSEKCIRGCDEEEVTPKDPSKVIQGTEKTIPEKTSPERVSSKRSFTEITTIVRPFSEKPSIGKIPAVTLPPEMTYHQATSHWKSFQDLSNWMENEFSADRERNKMFEGTLPVPRTPEKTFQLKSGIGIDAAFFLEETLNRINPSYDARIVVLLIRPNVFNHYVCSIKAGGKLYIMDYGTLYPEVTGVHGPYDSLEEYQMFYEEHFPIKRKVEAITYLK